MFRIFLAIAVALMPCSLSEAQTCQWQNGRWVCNNSARTITSSYSTPTRTYTRTYQYAQPSVSYSYGSHAGYATRSYSSTSYGSHGGYAVAVSTPVVVEDPAIESAPEEPATKATAACECGCETEIAALKDQLHKLTQRIKALEAGQYMQKTSKKEGPAFSWQGQEGPAFAWQTPTPATTVAMR